MQAVPPHKPCTVCHQAASSVSLAQNHMQVPVALFCSCGMVEKEDKAREASLLCSGTCCLPEVCKPAAQCPRPHAQERADLGAAAVMVSAGFVHLLGAAIVEMGALHARDFPWAPFLCACGFLVTLLADQLATGVSG